MRVPWTGWAAIGGLALVVGAVLLWKSTTRHDPTEIEQTWLENMRQRRMDESVAERLAAEVRSGTSSPGASYGDDLDHLVAIRWWDAREDAREAHARRWRMYAIAPAVIAAIALVLAAVAFRGRATGGTSGDGA